MEFEVNIIKFLQSGLSNGWISFFQVVTLFGSWLGLVIALFIIFRKKKVMAGLMLVTFVFAVAINFLIKNLVCRPRPFESFDFIVNYGGEGGYSMPSGHSVSAGVLATFLIDYIFQTSKSKSFRACGTIFITLFALLIAFSRMVLGVHYFTDVIVGLVVGVVFASIALLIYTYYKYKMQKQVEILMKFYKGDDDE